MLAQKSLLIIFLTAAAGTALILSAAYFTWKKMASSTDRETTPRDGQEWVVLLHGIFRSPRSMNRIQKALEKGGYRVINLGYPSTKESIENIAGLLHRQVRDLPKGRGRLHFVTHSLGAIVVRYYLAHHRLKNAGRVVMIAPPNRGSTLAFYLHKWMPYKWMFGKAGQEVTGGPNSLPLTLPAPRLEFGVIAGGAGSGTGINPLIPGDNDGTVKVEETKLEGMKDFVLIKGQHSTLLLQRGVIENVLAFLKTGAFLHHGAPGKGARKDRT